LWLEAALSLQNGDADRAMANFRGIVNAGRSIGDEPDSISQLVRMACRSTAAAGMERTLAQGNPSETALRITQELLELEADEPLILIAFRGERAQFHKMVEALKSGDLRFTTLSDTSKGNWRDWISNFMGARHMRLAEGRNLRVYTEAAEIAKLPIDQLAPRIKNLEILSNVVDASVN
jgi:hypothetical protein